MRILPYFGVACVVFLLLALPAAPQHPRTRPERIRHEYPVPPLDMASAPHPNPKVDAAQLNRDAAELAELAETIRGQIDQVAKNELPKDLNNNLRRIEKLAKHLRSEVSP